MAKTLDYDFTDPQFDGVNKITAQTGATLTVTRAADSTATVMDYFNVLKTVNADEPRFTGGRRVENECLQSSALNTGWTHTNCAASPGESDPFGGTDGWLLECDGVGDNQTYRSGSALANHTYTLSWYLKAGTANYGSIRNIVYEWAYFDLSAGTVVVTDAALDSAGIESVGNGWYRCWVVQTFAADTTVYNTIQVSRDGSSWSSTDGDNIYVYGVQFEDVSGQDDPAPSEYIATTTAAKAQWYATKRRTNLCLQSNDFDTTWANTTSTDSQAVAANPLDATVDAQSLNEDGSSGLHFIDILHTQNVTGYTQDNTVYTLSGYFKASNRNWIRFGGLARDGTIPYAFFNVASGAGAVGASTLIESTSIEDVGNDWYRCSVTFNAQSGSTAPTTAILIADADNSVNFQGLSQESILVYGIQIEKGSTATDYIATTTTVESSDFDTAITPTGLLIEEARTNLCPYSESIGGTGWSFTAAEMDASNAAVAPDGTTTAEEIGDNGTGTGGHFVRRATPFGAAGAKTISVFAKAAKTNYLLSYMSASSTGQYFDLSDGTLGDAIGTHDGAGIEDVGSGWYRCWFTDDSAGTYWPEYYVTDGKTVGSHAYNGDDLHSVYLWGAQCEAGSFPTSYIPTVASSVTRNKDDIQTSSIGTQWNDDAGTIYIDYSWPSLPENNKTFLDITDGGAGADRHLISPTGSPGNDFKYETFSSGGAAGDASLISTGDVVAALDTSHKLVCAYADSDAEAYANGTRTGTGDQTVDVPTGIDTLHIGQNYLEGATIGVAHFSRIVYYDERLADSALEDLSNNGPATSFPGSVAGDGGHIWPPRASDPRWTQIIADSGITASGNFIDDVHAALEALGSTTGQLDDLWKKVKTANSVTDTSEPYLY